MQPPAGPEFWSVAEHIGLIASISVAVLAWLAYRKKHESRIVPQPLEIEGQITTKAASKRFSWDLWDGRHNETNRRLDGHDDQLEKLWTTVREEDEKIRLQLNRSFQDIERALGRIEGKIDDR